MPIVTLNYREYLGFKNDCAYMKYIVLLKNNLNGFLNFLFLIQVQYQFVNFLFK